VDQSFKATWSVPLDYQTNALRLILTEANSVAQELDLPERLPITESDVTAKYIPAPRMARMLKTVGNITTSNYTYYCSVGYKFSFLTKNDYDKQYASLRRQYLWPISKVDTNAAYVLAKTWLSKISMDVGALDRNCDVHCDFYKPDGPQGEAFVPVYWVYWVKHGEDGHGSVASVELLLPTESILQLRVEKSEYILRPALLITN
jgi:hypothetical protein